MQTQTRQTRQQSGPQQSPPGNALAVTHPRLPYPLDLARDGVDEGKWRVLIDAIFPAAKSLDAVKMALAYCKARNLDVMKKPVHIVPMYSTVLKRMVETVWPSIAEIRTTATRTAIYAGCEEAVFGDDVTEVFEGTKSYDDRNGNPRTEKLVAQVTYPAWCRITVYKIVAGQRVAFPGPRVLWKESYARQGKADVPNEMWCKRPYGQLEKCAEAAALRKAFPEELGNEYAAEEMEGREIGNGHFIAEPIDQPPPERPTREQFKPVVEVTDVDPEDPPPLDDVTLEVSNRLDAEDQAATVGELVDSLPKTTRGMPETDWAKVADQMITFIGDPKSQKELTVKVAAMKMERFRNGEMERDAPQQYDAVKGVIDELRSTIAVEG